MLDALCKLLGIREDQAEDALRSERCARLTLSRRSLFGAALCTGAAFSFGVPQSGSTLASFSEVLKRYYSIEGLENLLLDRRAPLGFLSFSPALGKVIAHPGTVFS